MGMPIPQTALNGGEISPGAGVRNDLARYMTCAQLVRNWIPLAVGGIRTRMGTVFIREVKDSAQPVRQIPFVFAAGQNYAIEVGPGYMRFTLGGGTVESAPGVPYEIATPYQAADIDNSTVHPRIQHAQLNDILTLVHGAYAPAELKRLGHINWQLVGLDESHALLPPTGVQTPTGDTVGDSSHKTKEWSWVICSRRTGSDPDLSLPSSPVPDASLITPLLIACYTDRPVRLKWDPVDGAHFYDVFKGRNRRYGWIGSADQSHRIAGKVFYDDDGQIPFEGNPPPVGRKYFSTPPAWQAAHRYYLGQRVTNSGNTYECTIGGVSASSGGPTGTSSDINDSDTLAPEPVHWMFVQAGVAPALFPNTACYYENRRFIAGGTEPHVVRASEVGAYYYFAAAVPTRDDSAFELPLASSRYEEIRALVPWQKLIILTSAGLWVMPWGDAQLTATSFDAKPLVRFPASYLAPLQVGDFVLYVQEHQRVVRQIAYNDLARTYTVPDITVLAGHLFEAGSIISWAYAAAPNPTLFAVRSDGTLLSCTYMPEQDVVGWAQHTTDGAFEDVCSIPENGEDAVYFVVRRTVNGVTRKLIERMATWAWTDQALAVNSDCAVTFNGDQDPGPTGPANSITVSGGTTWDVGDAVSLLSGSVAGSFSAGDVGGVYVLRGGAEPCRIRVTARTDAKHATGTLLSACAVEYRGVAWSTWGKAFATFGGLGHLEGKTLEVLADGDEHPPVTVSSGQITLDHEAVKVVAGLAFVPRLETLRLNAQGAQIRTLKKVTERVFLEVEKARGLWVGELGEAGHTQPPPREIKPRVPADPNDPRPLFTGQEEVRCPSQWNLGGQIYIERRGPFPATIHSITPEVDFGR